MKRIFATLLLTLTLTTATGCHRFGETVAKVAVYAAVTAIYVALEDMSYDHYHYLSDYDARVYCEVDHDGYHHYEWRGHRHCRR